MIGTGLSLRRPAAWAAAALAACLAAAVLATPASAQCRSVWQPDPFGDSGGSLVLVCGDTDDRSTPQPKPKAKPKTLKKPTRAQFAALRFRSSPAISAKVRGRLIERLVIGDDAEAERVRGLIEADTPMRETRRVLRASGWSTRDLGDAYALAYIIMWRVVNDRENYPDAIDRAVRLDLRAQLARDRKVRGANDAKQQEYAEWLGSWTAVIAGSYNAFVERGDSAGAREWRENAGRLAESRDLLGVDLTEVKLTRKGIEPR